MANNNLSNRYYQFIVAVLVIGGIGAALLWIYRLNLLNGFDHYYRIFSDKEAIKGLLKSWGPWAPVAYIIFQALQVLFAPLPGEATGGFVAGYLFGAFGGTVYSMIGLIGGSVVAFLLGSWLEHRYVAKWVPNEIIERFHRLAESKGLVISLVIFVLPYFPKDYFCILLGMSEMSLGIFLFVVIIGRLPGALMFALQGAEVYKGEYYHFLVLSGIYVVLALILFIYRQRLYRWLKRLAKHDMAGKKR
jgi:uncharacterized membrane protein YdjX (TVP38/TMEM64 family)